MRTRENGVNHTENDLVMAAVFVAAELRKGLDAEGELAQGRLLAFYVVSSGKLSVFGRGPPWRL